jgi:hypothetical protein
MTEYHEGQEVEVYDAQSQPRWFKGRIVKAPEFQAETAKGPIKPYTLPPGYRAVLSKGARLDIVHETHIRAI